MKMPNKFAAYTAAVAVVAAPAAVVNGELLHQQCEDSALLACQGLGSHPLHTLEDGPHYVLGTATHTATGSGPPPAVRAANSIRQLMATPAQYPAAFFAEPEAFIKPWHGTLLTITSTARLR